MAATSYHHGVRIAEVTQGGRTIRTVATSVIGLIASSTDADAATFPIGELVMFTDLRAALAKAGTTGTLAKALTAIDNQVRTVVIVCRITASDDDDAITSAAVAAANKLLTAQASLGVRPRILGAPGLDNQAVTTALTVVAKKLRAMVYAAAYDCDTVAKAMTYRGQFAQRELMLIFGDFNAWDTTASASVMLPAVAVAMGLRAKIDKTIGWNKTISNVAVDGVTGLTQPLHFDLQDPDTDVGQLNAAGVTAIVNYGGGYRFWGSRTCSDEPEFVFESATRTAQVLQDTIAEGMLWAIDKPILPTLARDIIETINGMLRTMTGDSIVGGQCWLNETKNTTASLSGGALYIDYDYTPTPPLEDLELRQMITDSYFASFADLVNA